MHPLKSTLAILLMGVALQSPAQMSAQPPELAARIKEIGPVINPPETAKLYAPLQSPLTAADGVARRDVAYGPDPRHRLDVVKPAQAEGALRPVLVFVHGGGFVAGNKTAPGSPFYDNVMRWAVRNNMVGVNVTYRLAPQSPWPFGRNDVALAVQWVASNIAKDGGDPKRIFVVGHSAGATHVAEMVADPFLQQRFERAGTALAGAMLLSGVYDLTTFPVAPNIKAYFGEDPALYASRSPFVGLQTVDVPLFVASGELDPPEFRQQFTSLTDALCQKGRCPVRLDLPGHSHMSEIYAIGTADRQLSDAIAAFVAGALKP